MKVLLINSVCGQGSTGRIATDIHQTLIDNGEQCNIIFGRGKKSSNSEFIKVGNDFDFYSHILCTRLFDSHAFSSLNATKKIIDHIETWNPDIIHLHNVHGYYVNIELLFKYLSTKKTPIVWTLHDCWTFTGHCAYFTFANCNRWFQECYDCPQKKCYPKSVFLDRSRNNFKEKKKLFTQLNNLIIVTPSNWLQNIVNISFLSQYKNKVIYNGVNQEIFKYVESKVKLDYNISNKKIVLGVANVWEPRKGLKYLLELSEILDDDYQVVIIGLSSSQIAKLSKKVIGISKTKCVDELVAFYSAAYVFVNPTLEDNFPTTNIEALSCGTPVITFDTGGSPEAINEKCGIVVKEKSAIALKAAILNLNIDRNDCIKKSKSFSKEQAYGEYYNLYKSLLGNETYE